MKVPFLDLKQSTQKFYEEFQQKLTEILNDTSFVFGKDVEKFEQQFADYCKAKYCSGLNSGTDALKFALLGAGVGEGDEVITVPNTFIATTEVITQIGAKVVFVDIDEKTYNIDTEKIETVITSKTKAIIPVHLYGQCADIDPVSELASSYKLTVIEDACQAHGAKYKGKISGSLGDASAFSFYPGKNLGAFGDAGALITNNENIFNLTKMLRNHGQKEKYYHDSEGYNSRLDSIQAAILSIKLKYLDEGNTQRKVNAAYYNQLLRGLNIITPYEPEWSEAVYHLYVIRVKERDKLGQFLMNRGIGTGLHYPLPLHLQKAYKFLGYQEGSFPVTEKVAKEIISLPMFPELTKEQIEYVTEQIKEFMNA